VGDPGRPGHPRNPAGCLALLAVVHRDLLGLPRQRHDVSAVAPVTLVICRELKVPPYPFLFS